jgi:hypothetical protein
MAEHFAGAKARAERRRSDRAQQVLVGGVARTMMAQREQSNRCDVRADLT